MNGHTWSLGIFAVLLGATFLLTYLASRRTHTAEDFWAAGRSVGPVRNALAISGDFLSASTFLGGTGLICFFGFDCIVFLIIPTIAFVPVLLFYAERMRNLGHFTLTDILTSRFNSPSIRVVLALSTLVITGLYLLAQLIAAGSLFQLLAGISFPAAVVLTCAIVVTYVVLGGMLAATWVQVVKASLLLAVLASLVLLALVRIPAMGGIDVWIDQVTAPLGHLDPAVPGNFFKNGWNFASIGMALMFGLIGLPHVMMRIFTVPDAIAARKSASMTVIVLGLSVLGVIIVGLSARSYLGPELASIAKGGNLNVVTPMLASVLGGGNQTIGGQLMLGLVAAVAFATILAVMSGLLVNASSAVVCDLWPSRGRVDNAAEGSAGIRRGRYVSFMIAAIMAVVTIAISAAGKAPPILALSTLAIGVAASANFPALTLALFWRRFTPAGAVSGILVGLVASVVGVAFGPLLWHGSNPSPISLMDPAIFAVPSGFVASVVGTLLSKRQVDFERFEQLRLRSLIGPEAAALSTDTRKESKEEGLPLARLGI